jgi:hypothetical protein
MRIESQYRIRSMKDLERAKRDLREQISQQEAELLGHPLVSIPMSFLQSSSIKGSIQNSLESISLENYKNALMSLIGTVMLANKRTRKFFIGFVLAKELVPYAVQKIGELMKK